jgi:NAD(P)-dependent dehydrogenase (short-subunit alcohol dehydrogenase family)
MGTAERRVAVVTGANRGIGFAIARQLTQQAMHVVVTARGEGLGREALAELQKEGLAASFFPLDVTSDDSVAALATHLRSAFGRLDVLVNNAGVALDKWVPALDVSMDQFIKTYETNVFGVMRVSRALLPLMREELGGADAPRTPEEAADTAIWLATLPAGGPTGGFFQDRKPFPL